MHHKLLLGDPENIEEMPGVIAQHRRTNEILEDVRDALSRINWILLSSFLLALVALVFKNLPQK